jgi:hypothetical protein|tara:strand:+ start:667 stop:1152 length:486 start_codon:yes stop_codon:yes gene_type:complete
MENFVQAIEGSAVNEWIMGSYWAWPAMEVMHFIGLSLLLGALLVIDLRLAGFFRKINIAATHKLLPWAFAGFGINLTTGILFVIGDPFRYTANIGFWWKMGLLGVAGLNALWFWWKINPVMQSWEPHADTPALAKVIAWVSLGSWFGVLILGRLIPYIGTG